MQDSVLETGLGPLGEGARRGLRPLDAVWALAGPLLTGAVIGATGDSQSAAAGAALLTGVIIGVGLLMLPGLYVLASATRLVDGSREVMTATLEGFRDIGVVLCGLTPALAFLLAVGNSPTVQELLGSLVISVSVIVALRTLHHRLFARADDNPRALWLFLGWAVLALAVGQRLLATSIFA